MRDFSAVMLYKCNIQYRKMCQCCIQLTGLRTFIRESNVQSDGQGNESVEGNIVIHGGHCDEVLYPQGSFLQGNLGSQLGDQRDWSLWCGI